MRKRGGLSNPLHNNAARCGGRFCFGNFWLMFVGGVELYFALAFVGCVKLRFNFGAAMFRLVERQT